MSDGRRSLRPRLAFGASRRDRVPGSSADSGADRFRESILPHLDGAYSLACYLSRDPAAAEDIVQNAFLRAFRSIDDFRGEAPKAWLFAIVRNCFHDWLNRNRDAARLFEQGGGTEWQESVDLPGADTPETILVRDREAQLVRSTINDLPEPFRETLVLRELEDFSYKDIAMITDVSIGTVMSRLARARQMLCKILMPVGEVDRTVKP